MRSRIPRPTRIPSKLTQYPNAACFAVAGSDAPCCCLLVAKQVAAPAAGSRPLASQDVLAGALVLGATTIAYLPALRGGFVWNDSDYVTAPALRSLHGLSRIWFEVGATEQYYPLLHSAFWLQHRIFGDNPAGYHAVNLLFHLGGIVLFAAVLRKLFGVRSDAPAGSAAAATDDSALAAWLGAALFALHPVHVASVAWITEQKNTFSLLFYLGAALAYLRFDESRRPRHYLFALVLFSLAMLAKTSAVTLPAALLVVLWWKQGALAWRRDGAPLLPWVALGAGAGLFSSWVEKHHLGGAGLGATGADFELTPIGHVLLASRAVWFYLGNLVWPAGLNFIYPRWKIDGEVWWQWLFPAAIAAALAWAWARRQRTRTPLAVVLLFLGTLFPVLGFVNLYGARISRVWDHWQYLADLAPLALAGALLAQVGSRLRLAGFAPGVVLCLFLGALTWQRCGEYRDNETLYRATLARNPTAWLAQGNLATMLAKTPDGVAEAMALLEPAVQANPDNEELHLQFGTVLSQIPGRQQAAIEHYEQALRLKPNFPEAHVNLAAALLTIPGRASDARGHAETAVRFLPDSATAHYLLARALSRFPDQLAAAIAEYEAALRLNANIPEAHSHLAAALMSIPGRTEEAIAHFTAAAQLEPNSASAHYNLGGALTSVPGRTREALAEFEAALRLNPQHAQARRWVERLRAAGR